MILKEKEKLEQIKKNIALKEKILKKKELKEATKNLILIGKLAKKANIDLLDSKILLGAFLDIQSKKKDDLITNKWEKEGEEFLKEKNENEKTPMIISFEKELSKEDKLKLKNLKIKWNSFRKEWYGNANKQDLEILFPKNKITVEEIS